jgi:hypothetical protein
MPLFLWRYREADHQVIGLAIVSALDEILARSTAERTCPMPMSRLTWRSFSEHYA